MIIGDIRFIEITTVSSRLCVLTGGAFLVVFRSRLTAAFFFLYLRCYVLVLCPSRRRGKKESKNQAKEKKSVRSNI